MIGVVLIDWKMRQFDLRCTILKYCGFEQALEKKITRPVPYVKICIVMSLISTVPILTIAEQQCIRGLLIDV